jgi:hypothetical protein
VPQKKEGELQMSQPDSGQRPNPPVGGLYGPPGHATGRAAGPPAAPRRSRRFPARWIAVAVVLLAAVGAVTVIAVAGTGAGRRPAAGGPAAGAARGPAGTARPGLAGSGVPLATAGQPPAITRAQARQVLSRFWRVNNQANAQRSDALLGTIEAGSSYRLDAGAYRFDRASNPAGSGYAALALLRAAYYIPRQPLRAAYPHWFAAAVSYVPLGSPPGPAGSQYLLFSQASPGAAWKDVLEPGLLPAGSPAPRIAAGAGGYATAASPGPAADAAGLGIAPGRIGPVTAAALDHARTAAITAPAGLADLHDQAFWRSRLPAGSAASDAHQAGPGPVFGLRTSGGGAIVFYTVTAQLTLAPPHGQALRLEIPGYYNPGQAQTLVRTRYAEQFAAYDPPPGQGGPRIIADASGITSRG